MRNFNFLGSVGVFFWLFICLTSGFQESTSPPEGPSQLTLVLKGGREYCRRLEQAALDFVCLEEVSEKIDLSRDLKSGERLKQITTLRTISRHNSVPDKQDGSEAGGSPAKRQNTYLFDYQFVRRLGEIKEERIFLKKNGKRAKENEPLPTTQAFQYSDILLAPVRLLDERFREFYNYRLLGEDSINGIKAWVIEISPNFLMGDIYLGGRVWLKKNDASVLRIDWDPATFGGYEKILLNAKAYQSDPRITSYTEFGLEKNGLRFPSVDFTEEAYLGKQGKLYIRARTKVVYKNYRFFTVETETAVRKSSG